MKFLYGMKNCHACANRKKCKQKNDRSTLSRTPIKFDHTNRGLRRHGNAPIVSIESLCVKFEPEGEHP